ncbi:MAG: carboxypeptidase-like regulatory domain-containing protein [Pirellulaceae bacterium]
MNHGLTSFAWGLIVLSLLSQGGCGKRVVEGRPALVKVSGTVFYNQAPCSDARVVFSPQNHQYAAAAKTDQQGRFTLQTFDPGDGAVPGEYKVVVSKFEAVDLPGGGFKETFFLPGKYRDPQTSGLTATIPEAGTNDVRIELDDQ